MKQPILSWGLVCVALLVGLSVVAPTQAQQTPASQRAQIFNFPAEDTVFPEGVAKDPNSNFFYVGSTTNGAIYRGDVRQPNRGLSLFLPGGADGRTTAIGMKVDGRGFLFIAGGATGTIWMYDTRDGRLLSRFETGVQQTFINDVTITPDGAAYFTDSRNPVIYRIAPNAQGIFTLEFWRELNGTPLQYTEGFNLNGITASADGRFLVVVQSNTGQLFRIATDTKAVSEITLAGGDRVTAGDGILLAGQILHVTRNSLNLIVQIRLSPDFSSGQQVGSFTDPSFGFATTIAAAGDRLLVVNSQFNNRGQGRTPNRPFTVSSVPLPTVQ